MADQGEQVPQVPAGENLQAAQAVTVAQAPPPPLLQNQEEPANPNPRQNAAAGEVTLEVCSAYCFHLPARVLTYCISVAVLNFRSRRLAFNLTDSPRLQICIMPC